MAYYALVASLPNISIGEEPSLSSETFLNNCAQWISEQEVATIEAVLLGNPISDCSKTYAAWKNIEAQLQNAICKHRGQKLSIDFKEYLQPHDGFCGEIETSVTDAFTRSNPVELEEQLDQLRWSLAESLIGLQVFGFEKILAYAIQLKIAERWNRMTPSAGTKNIESVITANTAKEEAAETER